MVKPFRFLFLADMQLGCYASFSGMTEAQVAEYAAMGMNVDPMPRVDGFEWDARQYERAVAAANHLRPDFVVMGGDMVNDANREDQLDEMFRITRTLDPDIPFYWVPGNHDIAPDWVTPTADSIAGYRALFGDDFYAFDFGPARFLTLNTVVMDHPELVPGEWDKQLAFVDEELERARAEEAGPVIVMGHHPLFVATADEPDHYWNVSLAQRRPVLDRLRRHGVKLALAGHWHRNAIAWDGELQMVTTGPVGYPLGDDPSGYRVVDVASSEIRHEYRALTS